MDVSFEDAGSSDEVLRSTDSQRFLGATSIPSAVRAKSSLRLKYEAESQVIRRKLGDLESIRSQLGLSQRKISQLLLVDPSAWTRWTKAGETAPPHIYRMLQWYLALEERYPALDVNFWLKTVAQVTENESLLKTQIEKGRELESQVADRLEAMRLGFSSVIETKERRLRRLIVSIALLAVCSGVIIGYFASLLLGSGAK